MTDRPVMTDDEMIKDYPRLKLEYTRLHNDYRRLQPNQLTIAGVISRFLSDKVDYKSDSDVMIGMRGLSKNIPCLYYVTPVDYEPHRIEVLTDL